VATDRSTLNKLKAAATEQDTSRNPRVEAREVAFMESVYEITWE
jgi:hypothetical protein